MASSSQGEECNLTFRRTQSLSLDVIDESQRHHMTMMLNFLNTLVKNALQQSDYK
jgi:hypothetical protein